MRFTGKGAGTGKPLVVYNATLFVVINRTFEPTLSDFRGRLLLLLRLRWVLNLILRLSFLAFFEILSVLRKCSIGNEAVVYLRDPCHLSWQALYAGLNNWLSEYSSVNIFVNARANDLTRRSGPRTRSEGRVCRIVYT